MNGNIDHFGKLWQDNLLDYKHQNAKEKLDSLRYIYSQLSYLKENKCGFDETWSLECEELDAKRNYSSILDSKNNVNNYADAILSLTKGFKNESAKWECKIKPDDLQKFISNDEDSLEDDESEYAKLTKCFQTTKPKVFQSRDQINPGSLVTFKESDSPNFNFIDQSDFFERQSSETTRVNTQSSRNSNPQNSECNFSFNQDQSYKKEASTKVGARNDFPSVISKCFPHNKPEGRSKRYPWEVKKEQESAGLPSFKTASHQLAIDNQKKHGGRGGAVKECYGSAKRSLGPRGIKAGFVPPIRKEQEGECEWGTPPGHGESGQSGSGYQADLSDDRLKNIEAKMVELIMNEILDSGPPVNWDDIAGLQLAKSTIKEIVVWPMLRPDIFTGLRGPPKGILLFGPPGTGKTMIGKCIASQSQSTFFSISASSLTSKWVGEGEKMVRAMFAVARCHQPAVIFIDEIDSLLTQRSDTEHESSRRIKTEFLVQLDGATSGSEDRLLVVGATNRPQELDEAARRRLVKRLYIPLPDAPAREQIMKNLLADQSHTLSSEDLKKLSEKTDGYSGADMANLCREAALGPIRSINFEDIQHISVEQVRSISAQDFDAALQVIRASVSIQDLHLYEEWNKKYGIRS